MMITHEVRYGDTTHRAGYMSEREDDFTSTEPREVWEAILEDHEIAQDSISEELGLTSEEVKAMLVEWERVRAEIAKMIEVNEPGTVHYNDGRHSTWVYEVMDNLW